MDGGDVVTVVSVFVAGVLGPTITVRAAARAQAARLKHERTLHDLDDLRAELDRVADALGHLIRALSALFAVADDSERWEQRKMELRKQSGLMYERAARLKLRVDEGSDVFDTLADALRTVDAMVAAGPALSEDEVDARTQEIGDANTRFFRAANRLIGVQLNAAEESANDRRVRVFGIIPVWPGDRGIP